MEGRGVGVGQGEEEEGVRGQGGVLEGERRGRELREGDGLRSKVGFNWVGICLGWAL